MTIRTTPPAMHDPVDAGFTLIEMLVVLTIVGLLAGIAMSNLATRPAFVDRAQLRTGLSAAIAAARQQAVASGRPVRIDLARLAIAHMRYTPALDSTAPAPIVFPDGSTNGGTVSAGGGSAIAISWMTGQVGDAAR